MPSPNAANSSALRASYWRKEIIQLLVWMQGEGFGEHLDAGLLERALGVEARLGLRHLDELVGEGLLWRGEDGRYRPTEEGRRYGAQLVADEHADVIGPDPGAPGPDGRGVRAVGMGLTWPRRRRRGPREVGRRRA